MGDALFGALFMLGFVIFLFDKYTATMIFISIAGGGCFIAFVVYRIVQEHPPRPKPPEPVSESEPPIPESRFNGKREEAAFLDEFASELHQNFSKRNDVRPIEPVYSQLVAISGTLATQIYGRAPPCTQHGRPYLLEAFLSAMNIYINRLNRVLLENWDGNRLIPNDTSSMQFAAGEYVSHLNYYYRFAIPELHADPNLYKGIVFPPPPKPMEFTVEARLEHAAIVAGSGYGKTQTLEYFIAKDLDQEDPPALIVIDSKGDMNRRISHLDVFHPEHGRLRDRLLIIDPRQRPHLNLFDVGIEKFTDRDDPNREQALNATAETFSYFFDALLSSALTGKQDLIFRPLALLMVHIPGANIETMIEVMDDLKPYRAIIEQLPSGARDFLLSDFQHSSYNPTRIEVKRRLQQIRQFETFDRMLSAPTNQIRLAEAIEEKKIVLINATEAHLFTATSLFGKFFVSQTINSALLREQLPEHQRRPAFLYIDEAQKYFDLETDHLLTTLRSYKLGAILAFHYLGQAQAGLQSSIKTNTTIKLVGGVDDHDARAFAADMRTTPTFIHEQQKDARKPPRFTTFAAYIKNAGMKEAVSIQIPFYALDKFGKMDENAYDRLRERNKEKVTKSSPKSSPPTPPSTKPPPSEPPPDATPDY